ncbi:serine hydroxymethyltransferase [Gordonia spumicola]|uniref:Probable serine hydroxymethyltransferase n=1 Tax=Gordonia spumicola TaxID=589161 RepID=A0A7I9V9W9_9ACTN|nr:serine hydroxymethyltransferase [Gordonia spumicola]GEE02119.1 serine hydroxymethyltransferase [Gordonia spumicola]
MTGPLDAVDPQIRDLIDREAARRAGSLQLLAAETIATPAVRAAMGSVLADKYAEGYPGHRYHGGSEVVDEVENLAVDRAQSLFGADYVNVQPLSWALANFAVYAAFAQPGDQVMSLSLRHGGHQSHGSRANLSGRWFSVVNYEVRQDTEQVDYDRIRDMALIHRPRILLAGGTAYSRTWDYAAMRMIADEAGCVLWVDGAHVMGLAVGGVVDSPVPYADVVSVATNKVMRGPRGGLLLARGEHAEALSRAVYPFLQGAPAMHSIAAKAVAFAESGTEAYRSYARDVADLASDLARNFADRGLPVVSGGTDTHIGIVDVTPLGVTGREAARRLAASGIVVDKAITPFDRAAVAEGSAIRYGTAAVVAGGVVPADAASIADLMITAMSSDDAAVHAGVASAVTGLGDPE